MKGKNARILCLIMTIVVVCLGMCLKGTETDAFLPKLTTGSETTIHNVTDSLTYDIVCTRTEFTENEQHISILRLRPTVSARRTIAIICISFVLISLYAYFETFCAVFNIGRRREAVLIGYIHSADGKK